MNSVRGSTAKLRRTPIRRPWEIATAVLSLGLSLSAPGWASTLTVPDGWTTDPRAHAPGAAIPLLSSPSTVARASRPAVQAPSPAQTPTAWRLPLAFEPADDLAPADAGFAARGPGYSVFVNSGGALLALQRPEPVDASRSAAGSASSDRRRSMEFASRAGSLLRFVGLRFEGARSDAEARVEQALSGRIHRLRGAQAAGWQTRLQAYGRVVYSEVYPGIDLAYYGRGRELEYDFVVGAGADPSRARLRFEGIRNLRVREQGDLVLETGAGELVQRRPEAYQLGPEGREPVAAAYEVGADGTVGFRLGEYDRERTLVIDPVLSYATYLGGSGLDQCWDIAVDDAGYAFVVGETESVRLSGLRIVSTQAFQTNYQGGLTGVAGDAFVAKLNPDGTAFEWFTYLGGSDLDGAYALALGSGGEPVVVGFTASTNFPVTAGAYRTTLGLMTNRYTGRAPLDAFVTRLRADGSGLVSSTLFGGDEEDQALDVALLADQSVLFCGSTTSTNLPVAGVSASASAGSKDGFVAVLKADATGLLLSRFVGGSAQDSVEGIALNPAGDAIHLIGITESTNLPILHAVQSTNAGFYDVFAAGVRLADGETTYATYLGGGGDDYGYRVGVGGDGRVWLAGVTYSGDFRVANPWNSTNSGGSDALLARLSADGQTLEMSSYFGGSANDAFWDLRVDAAGRVHLAGETLSTNLPGTTAQSILSTNLGLSDILMVRVGTDGVPTTTLFGASGDELGYAVAADSAGNTYVAGRVRSVVFPVSSTNVAQPVYGGERTDGFVLKVAYEPALTAEPASEGIRVSWPAPNAGFVLESAPAGGVSTTWTRETAAVDTENGRHVVRLPMSATNCVFRLRWAR